MCQAACQVWGFCRGQNLALLIVDNIAFILQSRRQLGRCNQSAETRKLQEEEISRWERAQRLCFAGFPGDGVERMDLQSLQPWERSGLCLSWRPSHRQSQRPAANAPWKEHVSSRHSVFPIQDYFSAFYKIFNNWNWGERRKKLQNLFLFHFLKALHCSGTMELGITKTPDGVSQKNRELNWGKTRIAVMERYFKILKLEKPNNLKHFLVTKDLRIPWAEGRQQLLPSDEDVLHLHTCSWFT